MDANSAASSTDTELLTTEQVMEILLTDADLRRRAATCVLPAVRCGSEFRFRKRDLDRWICRQQNNIVWGSTACGSDDCGAMSVRPS